MTKLGCKRKGQKKVLKKRVNIKLYPLDILFSKWIRAKADYTCEYCGQKPNPKGLHCAHFIGRRYRNTRWLDDNASCLCFGCHNLMRDFPPVHMAFFVKRIGTDKLEQLEILARRGGKPDLAKIKAELESKLGRVK